MEKEIKSKNLVLKEIPDSENESQMEITGKIFKVLQTLGIEVGTDTDI